MIDYVLNFQFNSLLGICLYWLPAAICLLVYFFRGVEAYKRDLRDSTGKYYTPSLTIGSIVGHILLSLCPVANILASVFDCLSSIFAFLRDFLDIPLVRHRPAKDKGIL